MRLDDLSRRQAGVGFFYKNVVRREKIQSILEKIADVERIIGRIRMGRAHPRDLLAMKESLGRSKTLLTLFSEDDAEDINWIRDDLQEFDDLVASGL